MTVAQGVDPRELALVAFGGAGPLHACAIADALDMRTVIVPPRAGVLSAVGLLCSPRQREVVRSWPTPGVTTGSPTRWPCSASEVRRLVAGADRDGDEADVEVTTGSTAGTRGQSHELARADRRRLPRRARTPQRVRARVGAGRGGGVARPRDAARHRCGSTSCPPWYAAAVAGPGVVAEPDCTVWVPSGWRADPGPLGAWILRRTGAAP